MVQTVIIGPLNKILPLATFENVWLSAERKLRNIYIFYFSRNY